MDFIEAIDGIYEGNIRLNPPYVGEKPEDIPEEIFTILRVSNGIEETMVHPATGERMAIAWIIYPCEMIWEESSFYHEECGIEGVVFAADGADALYILKPEGRITCFEYGEETEAAGSLREFYHL